MNSETERQNSAIIQMLDAEQNVILKMRDLLESGWPEFDQAVELMHKATACSNGRVIQTGMGKSGHVAKKVTATMASLGTPSHFVHPAEASHGDLGMLTKNDVLVCYSNSGNTSELAAILQYAEQIQVPIIGITMGIESTLAKAATVPLIIPKMPEGCALGLAPTTSTTAQMALGDALSVGLSCKLEFGRDNFNTLHPGGSLGTSTTKVAERMMSGDDMPLIQPETDSQEICWMMAKVQTSIAGVIDEAGNLIGIVHAKDASPAQLKSAHDLMRTVEPVVSPEDTVATAVNRMQNKAVTAIFVVDGKRPVGVFRT